MHHTVDTHTHTLSSPHGTPLHVHVHMNLPLNSSPRALSGNAHDPEYNSNRGCSAAADTLPTGGELDACVHDPEPQGSTTSGNARELGGNAEHPAASRRPVLLEGLLSYEGGPDRDPPLEGVAVGDALPTTHHVATPFGEVHLMDSSVPCDTATLRYARDHEGRRAAIRMMIDSLELQRDSVTDEDLCCISRIADHYLSMWGLGWGDRAVLQLGGGLAVTDSAGLLVARAVVREQR